jgi:hypothetical protein
MWDQNNNIYYDASVAGTCREPTDQVRSWVQTHASAVKRTPRQVIAGQGPTSYRGTVPRHRVLTEVGGIRVVQVKSKAA